MSKLSLKDVGSIAKGRFESHHNPRMLLGVVVAIVAVVLIMIVSAPLKGGYPNRIYELPSGELVVLDGNDLLSGNSVIRAENIDEYNQHGKSISRILPVVLSPLMIWFIWVMYNIWWKEEKYVDAFRQKWIDEGDIPGEG